MLGSMPSRPGLGLANFRTHKKAPAKLEGRGLEYSPERAQCVGADDVRNVGAVLVAISMPGSGFSGYSENDEGVVESASRFRVHVAAAGMRLMEACCGRRGAFRSGRL